MKTVMCRRALLPLFAILLACAICGGIWGPALAAPAADGAPAYIMMVFNNPVDGKDAEFNDWYDHVHASEVTAQLGFDHAQRFVASPLAMGSETPRRYVVVYSGTSNDLAASYAGYFVNAAKAPPGPRLIALPSNYNDSFKAAGPQIQGRAAPVAADRAARSYLWFVYGGAAAGKEEAFETWFNGDFARALAAIPGMVSAQPYIRTEAQLGNAPRVAAPPHLILLRIRADDLAATMSAAKQTMDSLKSETADPASRVSYGFQELGPAIR